MLLNIYIYIYAHMITCFMYNNVFLLVFQRVLAEGEYILPAVCYTLNNNNLYRVMIMSTMLQQFTLSPVYIYYYLTHQWR